MKKAALLVAVAIIFCARANAQLTVFDPTSLAKEEQQLVQMFKTGDINFQQLTQAIEQVYLMKVMMSNLKNMGAYAIPSMLTQALALQQDTYGNATPWKQTDNTGVAAQPAYQAATTPLVASYPGYAAMTPDEQMRLRALYATVELRDGASENAMGAVGQARADMPAQQAGLQQLQADSLSPSFGISEVQVAQKTNAAVIQLLRMAQDRNNMEISALETENIVAKQKRDEIANAIATNAAFQSGEPAATSSGIAGFGAAAAAWRLP
jgi:hypothetical protein